MFDLNSIIKKPGLITIVIGPVISPKDKNAKEITKEVENWIEKTVKNITK